MRFFVVLTGWITFNMLLLVPYPGITLRFIDRLSLPVVLAEIDLLMDGVRMPNFILKHLDRVATSQIASLYTFCHFLPFDKHR